MMDSTVINGIDIIESIHTEPNYEIPKTEIFERDELWNQYSVVQQLDVSSNKASSGVWKYFGRLQHDNQIVDQGYFYCGSCYDNRITKKYQTNTSTGNLIKHMLRAHGIQLEHPVYRIKRESDSYTVIKDESELDPVDISNEDVIYDLNQILIDEVQKRPHLYDPKLCQKNKHRIRQSLWMEVYETLNHLIPLERLPKIWKNIRDRYQKVRRSCEREENKVPKYRYYERLRFLDSVIDSSINKTIQSALIKLDDDDTKVKRGYFGEDKNQQNEFFEVLELDDLDDMENVEVNNESIEETVEENNVEVKREGSAETRSYSSELNDAHSLTHYEMQNNSEIDEHELFSIDNTVSDDIQPPNAKRIRIDIPYERICAASETSSKPDEIIEKSTAVSEFEIFGNYVGAVMKDMRKADARQLQMKIVQLINSYDEDEQV